jgi:hypothetical protein
VIIYDLKCEKGHKFEGWFQDRTAFEDQKVQKLVACPICGGCDVEMVLPSLAVVGKEGAEHKRGQDVEISPIKALHVLHEYLDKNFDDVGDKFAEVALKMHRGEEERRNIKGTSTRAEEDVLKEDGVQFIKVPVPKFDS